VKERGNPLAVYQIEPLVRTYRKPVSVSLLMPNQVTAIKCYGRCGKCHNIFNRYVAPWSKKSFNCPVCRLQLEYINKNWRTPKVPLVIEGTDLAQYLNPQPKLSATEPAISETKSTIATDTMSTQLDNIFRVVTELNSKLAMLELDRIYRILVELNNKW